MKRFSLVLSIMLALTPRSYSATYLKGGSLIEEATVLVSSGGTTTLTKDTNSFYSVTGTAVHTIVMPNATTLVAGRYWEIHNGSTKVITIQANGGAILRNLSPNEKSKIKLTANGTAAGTWAVENNAAVNIAQAVFFGGIEQVASAGPCVWNESTSTSNANFVDLSTSTTGCNAWTVTPGGAGTVAAVGTNDYRISATGMQAGYYDIEIIGLFYSSAASQLCFYQLSDGTNSYQPQGVASSSATYIPSLKFGVSYTAPQSGTVTFKLQASDNRRWKL